VTRKDNIVKHLKMMGYYVNDMGYGIQVYVKMNDGFCAMVTVSEELIYEDYVIEHVVARLNGYITSRGDDSMANNDKLISHTSSHKKVIINLDLARKVLDRDIYNQLNEVLVELNHVQETKGVK
jgi:hypothetical protein